MLLLFELPNKMNSMQLNPCNASAKSDSHCLSIRHTERCTLHETVLILSLPYTLFHLHATHFPSLFLFNLLVPNLTVCKGGLLVAVAERVAVGCAVLWAEL